MKFHSAFNKAMRLLKTKETINFFPENTQQKKRIKKLTQIVQDSQNNKLDFNTDLLISVRSAANSSVKTLTK